MTEYIKLTQIGESEVREGHKNMVNKVTPAKRNSDGAIGYFKVGVGGIKFDSSKAIQLHNLMEVAYSNIGKLLGIDVVECTLAELDGELGVFSKLEVDENTELRPLVDLIGRHRWELRDFIKLYKRLESDSPDNTNRLLDIAILDMICFQGDRNTTNLMYHMNNGKIKLYPAFDNEECLLAITQDFNFDIQNRLVPDMGWQFMLQSNSYIALSDYITVLTNIDPNRNWFTGKKIKCGINKGQLKRCLKDIEPFIGRKGVLDIIYIIDTQLDYVVNELCEDSRA